LSNDVFLHSGLTPATDVEVYPSQATGAAPAITGTGATVQATQAASATGVLRFLATGVAAQSTQSASATGVLRFVGSEIATQSAQTGAGFGTQAGGAVEPVVIVGGGWWPEVKRQLIITGTGATRQKPQRVVIGATQKAQRAAGRGWVYENDDWLLGMADDDELLLLAA